MCLDGGLRCFRVRVRVQIGEWRSWAGGVVPKEHECAWLGDLEDFDWTLPSYREGETRGVKMEISTVDRRSLDCRFVSGCVITLVMGP